MINKEQYEELKESLKKLNEYAYKTNKRELLIIKSVEYLKNITGNLNLEGYGIFFAIEKMRGSLLKEVRELTYLNEAGKSILKSSEELLNKLDAQQAWFFENIDEYVEKQVESKLNVLKLKGEKE